MKSTLTYHGPVTISGYYVDSETSHRIVVDQDHRSESPVHWLESDETFWPFKGSRGNIFPLPAESEPAQVFERLLTDCDEDFALRVLNRVSRIYGTGEQFQVSQISTSRSSWYSVLEPLGGSLITEEFTQWCQGSVYAVWCLDCESINLGGIYADTEEEAITYYLEEGHHND